MTDQSWRGALDAARAGDVERARALCDDHRRHDAPFPGAHEYLLGRCLAEAGQDLEEALELLGSSVKLDASNILTPHVMALALIRLGRHGQARRLLDKASLPHDEALVSQFALTLETLLRPWPDRRPEGWPPWPPQLGPEPSRLQAPNASTPTTCVTRPMKMSGKQKRQLRALLVRLEKFYYAHEPTALLKEVGAALGMGLESAELHLIAGLAAEEGGDGVRARVHLAIALDLEPAQLMSRTFLGRAYWRSGWNDLACDLWRSLPVEGPDDFGRHYHLALAHEIAGRRSDALYSLHIALRDFYVETREFFIKRIYDRWLAFVDASDPDAS